MVCHFIIGGVIAEDALFPNAPILLVGLMWSALAVIASLALLPRIKGALVGCQWALRMHGFGDAKVAEQRPKPV